MPSLGQKIIEQESAEHESDTIKMLLGLSDSGLMDKMGLTAKMKAMRDILSEADTLTGEKREKINNRLEERLAPQLQSYDIEYMVEDLTGKKKKGGGDVGPC
jgi:hypothetical protein